MVDINQRSNPKESLSDKLAIVLSIVSSPQKIDIFFIAFSLLIGYSYFSYISTLNVPVWDGAVYLLNAKDWIGNTNLLQPYRPPLLSWIIDGIWVFTGEDWKSVKYIQAIFTISANVLLYLVLRKKKSPLFALGVCALTFSNSQLFFILVRYLVRVFHYSF